MRFLNNFLTRLNESNWASVTIIFSLLTIIYTHQLSEWTEAKAEFREKQALLISLKIELKEMIPWAEPSYADDPLAVYQKEKRHPEWYDPSLRLFSFSAKALTNLTNMPGFSQLNSDFIQALIFLNHKMNLIDDRKKESSQFIYSNPTLYSQARHWITAKGTAAEKTPDLEDYLAEIYLRNYKIYVCGIGGIKRVKSDCGEEKLGLHTAWRNAMQLIYGEIAALKAPLFFHYFWLPLALFLFFGIPSLWSFIKRIWTTSVANVVLLLASAITIIWFGQLAYRKIISPLDTSDEIQASLAIIQVLSVVVLGGIALFEESIKRWLFNPELKIDFKFAPPDCHKTEFREEKNPINKVADAYFFRFSVENTGKTHAQKCEAVLETLAEWKEDKKEFENIPRWNPINLVWSGRVSTDEFRTINPARKVFCDIGHIDLRFKELFILEANRPPFNQENFFRKGKYKFGISVYCENSRRGVIPKIDLIIDWSGEWHDDEATMFRDKIKLKANCLQKD